MDMEMMKRKYAFMLARVGLNVQPGQPVLVDAPIEGAYFMPIFAEECYKLGASNVVIHYNDEPTLKVAAKYRSEEAVRSFEAWEADRSNVYLEQGACYLRLDAPNPKLMADVPEEKVNAIVAHNTAVRKAYKSASQRGLQWLVATVPTQSWAEFILKDVAKENALDELWKLLFKICYIDETNDIEATWAENKRLHQERDGKMDAHHFRKLHYSSELSGTDLTVTLTPYSKYGFSFPSKVPFIPNLPTEEIGVAPEKYGTNGVVYATKPLLVGGKSVENFGFRFENGKVVEVIAEEGKDILEALVATDEGASYLGEAALVEYHSPISMSNVVFYNTLIDENASCHLALGRTLVPLPVKDTEWTFNQSSIHVDFMIGTPDMRVVGTHEDGTEVVVFENGDFAI
ncbi:MAG: aminopeptidase [Ruminiclostridium sp.]|nr:aminopeptidase [Ruminiclostridium sp.]